MSIDNIHIQQGWPENPVAVARFLDQNKEFDTISPALLEEKLFDDPHADPELCFTAFYQGQVVGFIFAVRRSEKGTKPGYIKLFAVEKTLRRQKIGSRLYDLAEKNLVQKGATMIRWYDVPMNYLMPGLDPNYTEAWCFALSKGFKKTGEAINMIVNLSGMNWTTEQEEQKLKQKGLTIRRATIDDMPDLLELLSTEWQLWNNEVEMAMKDTPPSVHIAFKDDTLKAFSVHNGNNKGTGWFGPMGTHPNLRGLGAGSILLKRCLHDMYLQGFKTAVIPWVGPVAFYAHYTKARINRVFWRIEKEIKTN